MVHGHVETAGDPAGETHGPVGGGPHRGSGRDPVVDAPVAGAPGLGRRLEGAVDGTVDGGHERQGSGENETDHFHLQGRDELEGEGEGKAAMKGSEGVAVEGSDSQGRVTRQGTWEVGISCCTCPE
jgi:hypothetical protein